eukprot:TRINITY_DN31387_c0_g1_i1.p1 TRINITY_DN31387_c0_g1~~TRINITY_DN31387_c0_g1_i1.p1  ORF type:complete len:126 (-),score=10.43 TRINITY_DN31387_c0_g1_i1:51-374(-)
MVGVGFVQCLGWMTFSGNPELVETYYGMKDPQTTIDLLLNWGPIMYLPMAPLVGWITMKHMDSVWIVVLAGALLTMVGLLVRLAPTILPGMTPTSAGLCLVIMTGCG